jgi:hypothetical protein
MDVRIELLPWNWRPLTATYSVRALPRTSTKFITLSPSPRSRRTSETRGRGVRIGLFASFRSLAGRFWSTPISGHISRLSWVENEPHAGRVFTLEESLVCVLPFSRASMKFVEQSNFTDRDAAGTPAHRDRQHDSGVNLFRESVLTRGKMNQIHATT